MSKTAVVVNSVTVVSFLAMLGVIYYLGMCVINSYEPFVPTSGGSSIPLPFILP
jgi:hypothetical protein